MQLKLRYVVVAILATHVLFSQYVPFMRHWSHDGEEREPDIVVSKSVINSTKTANYSRSPPETASRPKYAYVTLLCDDLMSDAALVLVHSLKKSGTPFDIIVLALKVSSTMKYRFRRLGAKVFQISKAVTYPFKISSQQKAINKPCRYSKLLIWNLTQYDKIVYVDSDLLVLKNIDDLFERPPLSAAPDALPSDKFNSGLMVIKPDKKLMGKILSAVKHLTSPNAGDQGFLNNFFPDWYGKGPRYSIGYSYNAFIRVSSSPLWKHFVEPNLKVLHFSGTTKPWNMKLDKQFPTTRQLDHVWWKEYNETYFHLQRVGGQEKALEPTLPHCQRDYMAYQRGQLARGKLSVVMNSFDRFEVMRHMVRVYASLDVVHKIYVVWGNTQVPPYPAAYFGVQKPVEVLYSGEDNLNDRFKPIASLETEAVLICDDDIEVSEAGLKLALASWQESPSRLVGFFPRSHKNARGGTLRYVQQIQKSYSMVLTKMWVMSAEYLWLYSCHMPRAVRKYVDRYKNCEDITMNFLASQMSGLPPLFVEDSTKVDYGTTSGLSSRKKHDGSRNTCMDHLRSALGYFPLTLEKHAVTPFTQDRHVAARDLSSSGERRVRPYPLGMVQGYRPQALNTFDFLLHRLTPRRALNSTVKEVDAAEGFSEELRGDRSLREAGVQGLSKHVVRLSGNKSEEDCGESMEGFRVKLGEKGSASCRQKTSQGSGTSSDVSIDAQGVLRVQGLGTALDHAWKGSEGALRVQGSEKTSGGSGEASEGGISRVQGSETGHGRKETILRKDVRNQRSVKGQRGREGLLRVRRQGGLRNLLEQASSAGFRNASAAQQKRMAVSWKYPETVAGSEQEGEQGVGLKADADPQSLRLALQGFRARLMKRYAHLEEFRPLVRPSEHRTALLFMGRLNNTQHLRLADLAEAPHIWTNQQHLCLMGGPRYSPEPHYALLSSFTIASWQDFIKNFSRDPSAPRVSPLALNPGKTLILYSQVGFEPAFSVASLASVLLSWRAGNGCFPPSKTLIFHHSQPVRRLGPWARMVLSAALGVQGRVLGPGFSATPQCFEEAVVVRRRETELGERCNPYLDTLRAKVHAQCRAANGSLPPVPTDVISVLLLPEAANGTQVPWLSWHSVSARLATACQHGGVQCRVQQGSGGGFCQAKMLGLGSADIIIGLPEDHLWDDLAFLRPNTTILDVRSVSFRPAEVEEWTKQTACLDLSRTEVLMTEGEDGFLRHFSSALNAYKNGRRYRRKKLGKLAEKCLFGDHLIVKD